MNALTLVVQGPPEWPDEQRLIGQLPEGEKGTEATVAAMVGLIGEASTHPLVRDVAHNIANTGPSNYAAGVFAWLKRTVKFHTDPPDLELLRHPARMIQALNDAKGAERPIGDCDDVADLGASLLVALGMKPVLVVAAKVANGPFVHVYTGLQIPGGGYYPLDPQEKNSPGDEVPAARRRVFAVL